MAGEFLDSNSLGLQLFLQLQDDGCLLPSAPGLGMQIRVPLLQQLAHGLVGGKQYSDLVT